MAAEVFPNWTRVRQLGSGTRIAPEVHTEARSRRRAGFPRVRCAAACERWEVEARWAQTRGTRRQRFADDDVSTSQVRRRAASGGKRIEAPLCSADCGPGGHGARTLGVTGAVFARAPVFCRGCWRSEGFSEHPGV